MHSTARLAVSMVLLTYAITSAYQNSLKLRRDGVLNLYPFPRVGRASLHRTWQVPLTLHDLRSETSQESMEHEKRQLYAFPRVGRGGMQETQETQDTVGMWFGPRLGRALRNSEEDDINFENYNRDRSEPEQLEEDGRIVRKKRQMKPQ